MYWLMTIRTTSLHCQPVFRTLVTDESPIDLVIRAGEQDQNWKAVNLTSASIDIALAIPIHEAEFEKYHSDGMKEKRLLLELFDNTGRRKDRQYGYMSDGIHVWPKFERNNNHKIMYKASAWVKGTKYAQ